MKSPATEKTPPNNTSCYWLAVTNVNLTVPTRPHCTLLLLPGITSECYTNHLTTTISL